MLKLAVSDAARHAHVWAGVFAVAAVCGLIDQYGMCLVATGGPLGHDGMVYSFAGSGMMVFSAIAVVAVTSSVGNLTVARQRESHALWQLAGASPKAVRHLVLLQLGLTGGCREPAGVRCRVASLRADGSRPSCRRVVRACRCPFGRGLVEHSRDLRLDGGASRGGRAWRCPTCREDQSARRALGT